MWPRARAQLFWGCAVAIWPFGTKMVGFGAVLTPIKREPKPRVLFLSDMGAEAHLRRISVFVHSGRFLCARTCARKTNRPAMCMLTIPSSQRRTHQVDARNNLCSNTKSKVLYFFQNKISSTIRMRVDEEGKSAS